MFNVVVMKSVISMVLVLEDTNGFVVVIEMVVVIVLMIALDLIARPGSP